MSHATSTLLHAVLPARLVRSAAARRRTKTEHGHLSGLVSSAMDAIIMVDDQHAILLFNVAAETMFGYRAADIIGRPLSILLPMRFHATHGRQVHHFGVTGGVARRMGNLDSVAACRADGTEFPAEASISHFRIGQQVFYTAIVRDISERIHHITALRASEERERAHAKEIADILFAVPAAVCIARDPSLSNITENELHRKWFGMAGGADLSAPEVHPFRDALQRAANGNEVRNYRFSALHRDGTTRHLLGNAITLRDENMLACGAVCAFVDVTDLKMSELTVLAEAKGSAAKSDYITHMTHELRTPLGTMLGYAQLLERARPSLPANQLKAVEQILKAGWHLRGLIEEVQQLSAIDAHAKQPAFERVELDGMLQDLHAMIAPLLLEKQISAFFKSDGNLAIKGSPQYCKQVMLNLLSNAIKYNRHGGAIHVSCEPDQGQTLCIVVRDTGYGLDPEQLLHLFQPFNRLGQESGREVGTGVGLIVTKRLVEAMGGAIGVSSTPGIGTSFQVHLPIAQER